MPAIAGTTMNESPIAPCQGTLEVASVFALRAIARKFEKTSRSALFIMQVNLSNVQTRANKFDFARPLDRDFHSN